MRPVKFVVAAALALAGAVEYSWAANPPWDPSIQFTKPELAQAEGECDKGTADFRTFYARFLGKPYEDVLIVTGKEKPLGWYVYAQSLACLDLAGDPKWSCGFLAPAKGKPADAWRSCQETKVFPMFAGAILRGGDPKAVYQQWLEILWEGDAAGIPGPVKEKLLQGFSHAVKTGDIQPLCAVILANKLGAADMPACQMLVGFLSGDPRQCAAADFEADRKNCATRIAVLEALKSQDPKACSSHLLCDVMTKRKPALCAPLVKEANAVFCGAVRALTKGKAPPPVDTAKKDLEAKRAKEKALVEEAARKEKERVAEFHRKRAEEEKKYRKDFVAAEIRKAQEEAAKKRELDEKVRRALEERKAKKQFKPGQRMDPGPLDAMRQIDKVNSGAPLPKAKEIKDE